MEDNSETLAADHVIYCHSSTSLPIASRTVNLLSPVNSSCKACGWGCMCALPVTGWGCMCALVTGWGCMCALVTLLVI